MSTPLLPEFTVVGHPAAVTDSDRFGIERVGTLVVFLDGASEIAAQSG